MIFANLHTDKVVQLLDGTRLDASKSIISRPDVLANVAKVEIAPDGFNYQLIKDTAQNVPPKDWFLDWVYQDKNQFFFDEDWEDTSATNFSVFSTAQNVNAQSWVATGNYNVVSFKTHARTGGPGVGTVGVRMYEGTPLAQGPLLATSQEVSFVDLPADNTTLTTFTFPSPVPVVDGQSYFFAISIFTTDNATSVNIYYPGANTYPNGNRFVSSNGGLTYTSQGNDLSFIIDKVAETMDGIVNPLVRITATDGRLFTASSEILLLSQVEDYLFSDDNDLIARESEVLKYLPPGRTSFRYKHRQAQTMIVDSFNESGVTRVNGEKLTKQSFVDIDEVRQWSANLVLGLIFEDNSNVPNDVFGQKSTEYYSAANASRHRAFYRLDLNDDNILSLGEGVPFFTKGLVRR